MQAQQLIEFLGNHPALALAFVAICAGIAWTFIVGRTSAGKSVTPMEAVGLTGREDAVVVDVRGEGEFSGGHIVNALNVPETALKDSTARLDKLRERTLIVVCKNGQRAGAVADSLRKQGFQKALALQGGIAAWQNAGYPLTRKK